MTSNSTEKIRELSRQIETRELETKFWEPYYGLLKEFEDLVANETPSIITKATLESTISISTESGNFSSELSQKLEQIIQFLKPWRLGPYSIFYRYIDPEWQAISKWEMLKKILPELRGKKIADVGCNNGYFMFQMSAYHPESIVGFEPVSRCINQFKLLNRLVGDERITISPLGIDNLDLYPENFDFVLCMGVLYHRKEPVESLRKIFSSLTSSGTLFLETLSLEESNHEGVIPNGRYAKMRNVYHIPSQHRLLQWILDAGFQNPKICYGVYTSRNEQRQTLDAPYESLSDFLMPGDKMKTIEGHPAPYRVGIICSKG